MKPGVFVVFLQPSGRTERSVVWATAEQIMHVTWMISGNEIEVFVRELTINRPP